MVEWKVTNKLVEYQEAINFMENKVESIFNDNSPELVWLLEHEHLYSAGTSAKDNELIRNNNFPVYKTGRGGKYTYHGPGQRIGYVMLNLKKRYYPNSPDLKLYIWHLEEWLIKSLDIIGIKGERRKDRIGIWVATKFGEKKIAAIGVRVRKWITYHGFALNINPNLDHFNHIIPCGISEYGVTSIEQLGYNIAVQKIDEILKKKFLEIFK
ncbi:MAG: lipoyl(octanoyl) transferase LipB [Alphaproteobacteria bacterium]